MYIENIGKSISFHLKNIALSSFSHDATYENIISPFTRIYLVTEGHGFIVLDGAKTNLEADHLYLIPSFTPCTYFFGKNLRHYYIHFSMELPSGPTVYNLFHVHRKKQALPSDYKLFQKCLELNPDIKLPHHDPKVYQSKLWINKEIHFHSLAHYLETTAVIAQLFSRFVGKERNINVNKMANPHFQNVLIYIQQNLNEEILVSKLAEMAFISQDHFSRIFKSITGLPPSEYIIRKRLDKAKLKLLTTNASLSEIISQTGFRTTAYFCRMFKKYTGITPGEFRKSRG